MEDQGIKVLAVASGGGHWEQLMLLRPTLANYDTHFATTEPAVAAQHGISVAAALPDCNQNTPLKSLQCALDSLRLVMRIKPDVIVSTGSAPGFLCLLAGRLTGARTLWIDSVANADQLSLSGRMARILAHQCWTQWEHLAAAKGPQYHGAVL